MNNSLWIEGVSALEFVLPIVLFLHSMIMFLGLKNKKHKWLDRSGLTTFVLYWIVALVMSLPVRFKVFITILMLSMIVIRILVTRKRKEIDHNPVDL